MESSTPIRGPRRRAPHGRDARAARRGPRAGRPRARRLHAAGPDVAHGLHRVVDAEDQGDAAAQAVLELALPLPGGAAGAPARGPASAIPEPLCAIQDAVNVRGFDEIILSTLPARVSRWLRLDLPSKVGGLGLPVTTVTARERSKAPVLGGVLDGPLYNPLVLLREAAGTP